MKKHAALMFMLLLSAINISALQSGLVTYDGGYFVKSGNEWTEYRPGDKMGVWATYTQYNEENNYYNISNSSTTLSIPKSNVNSIYIWNNDTWNKIYTTLQVYGYFDNSSQQIYAYTQNGYFVRDGDNWREYRPDKKEGIWAAYTQYKVDDNYFYLRNEKCDVCVPKALHNSFYILNGGEWCECYTTSAIYDPYAGFDYVLDFDYYRVADNDGTLHDYESPAKLYLTRKGEGMISCGHGNFKFEFDAVTTVSFKGSDTVVGFKLYPDQYNEDKYILVFKDWCMVNIEDVCEYMNLNDGDYENTFNKIISLIQSDDFFRNY